MKDQYAAGWSRQFLIVQNIRNRVLAGGGQSGGCEIDRAILLLVRPIKDGRERFVGPPL